MSWRIRRWRSAGSWGRRPCIRWQRTLRGGSWRRRGSLGRRRIGSTLMTEGTITGMNGVLVGIAKVKGLRGICLLGETSGYIVDPKASQAVLEALSRLLGIKVDLSILEDR